jgi:hypothetical protein
MTGEITRDEFFMHLGTWRDGGRTCQVTIPSDGQFDGLVTDVDGATSQVTFLCDKIHKTIDLCPASSFRYLDYNDSVPEMVQYFAAEFPAWLRAFADDQATVSLLLLDD